MANNCARRGARSAANPPKALDRASRPATCCEGEAGGRYLQHRIERAFVAGWAAKSSEAGQAEDLRREALEILTAIMRADLGELVDVARGKVRLKAEALAGQGKYVQAATFDEAGNLIGVELASRIEAIDLLARLLGWYAPERHEHRQVQDWSTAPTKDRENVG